MLSVIALRYNTCRRKNTCATSKNRKKSFNVYYERFTKKILQLNFNSPRRHNFLFRQLSRMCHLLNVDWDRRKKEKRREREKEKGRTKKRKRRIFRCERKGRGGKWSLVGEREEMRGRSFCSVFRISFFGIDGEYVSGIRLRRMEDPFVRAAVINGGTIARVPWDMIVRDAHTRPRMDRFNADSSKNQYRRHTSHLT